MSKYKGYFVDLDGTIYRGKEPIPAGKRFIEKLQANHVPFLLLTNNTTKTPKAVQANLAMNFDIQVEEANIYTATLAAIDYMKDIALGDKVFVVGEMDLKQMILEAGFKWEEERPDYVVVALDSYLTYEDLAKATLAIQKGAHFIGTNPDKNIPTERGLMPGAGSIIQLVQTATRVEPTVIGKPNTTIMEKALERIGLSKKEVLMVGDNYDTDIQAGIQNKIDTLLVLSGFTQQEDVPKLPVPPTYVLNSLDEWEL